MFKKKRSSNHKPFITFALARSVLSRVGKVQVLFIYILVTVLSNIITVERVGATAAIALRGTPTTNTSVAANVATIAVNKPTGVIAGDVMIATVAVDAQNQTAFTVPSGWTLILHSNNGTTVTVNSYWKAVAATDGASFSWSWTGATRAAASITAYSGVDSSAPIDVTGVNATGSGTAVAATSITTVSANAWVVGIFAGDAAATVTWTPPASMNERVDIGSAHTTSNDVSIEQTDVLQAAAGASGNKTATSSATTTWAAHLFALKPAPAPTVNQSGFRFSSNADNNFPSYIQDNVSAGDDLINGSVNDTITGTFYSVGTNGTNWVIERRRIADGSLCTASNCTTTFGTGGVIIEDVAGSATESAVAAAIDPSGGYLYIVGYDAVTANNQWRIEKRDMFTGALVNAFGTSGVVQYNPSSANEEPTTIIIDNVGGYIFIGGYNAGGNDQWSLEKRRVSDGALCTAAACGTLFRGGTSTVDGIYEYNPSSASDRVSAMEIDPTNTYVYLSGISDAGSGKNKWIVQKIRADSSNLCTAGNCGTQFATAGTYTIDPTNRDDKILALKTDSAANAIYIAGFEETGATSSQWRIQKLTLDTGVLVTAFGGSGCVTNVAGALCLSFSGSGYDKIVSMALDGSGGFIYLLGVYAETATDSQWRAAKINRSDGSAVTSWATSGIASFNPSVNKDQPSSVVIDVEKGILWAAGGDRTISTTNSQWRFEELELATGTQWLADANTIAGVSSQISFRIRILLHATTQTITTADSFKLQYSSKVGTCDTAFVGETYVDVATNSGTIRYHDNPTPADAATAQAQTGDPTHGADVNTVETLEEANNFTTSSDVPNGADGLWDFALEDQQAFGAYCFRVVTSSGSTLSTYSFVPEMTFCRSGPQTDVLLRHGTFFCEGLKKSFYWSD